MLLNRNYLSAKFDKNRDFIVFIMFSLLLIGVGYTNPLLAPWVGFAFAAYSVVANDSIQTIGTFIASNKDKPWWALWIFIGSIFVVTTFYSWYTYGGDVSYLRLSSKGFSEAPTSFTFLQVAAPLFLLILTRLKVPVSTTFLILSCFASSATSIEKVMTKSVLGYGVAFVAAFVLWFAITKYFKDTTKDHDNSHHPVWRVFQWMSTGALWSIWLMQDASNVAVFLPRSLSVVEYGVFATTIVVGLGWIFYRKGEEIQSVVEEKSDVIDIKSATLVDIIYAGILYIFKIQSSIPMSTTWVFVGLLAGREIAKSFSKNRESRSLKEAVLLSLKDLGYVTIGLVISLIIAIITNDAFRMAWLGF